MPRSNASSVLHPTGVRQQTTANICGCRRRRPEISVTSGRVTARWVLNVLKLGGRSRDTLQIDAFWDMASFRVEEEVAPFLRPVLLAHLPRWCRQQERMERRCTSGKLSAVASRNTAVFVVMPYDIAVCIATRQNTAIFIVMPYDIAVCIATRQNTAIFIVMPYDIAVCIVTRQNTAIFIVISQKTCRQAS
jgi:hypothetical protein